MLFLRSCDLGPRAFPLWAWAPLLFNDKFVAFRIRTFCSLVILWQRPKLGFGWGWEWVLQGYSEVTQHPLGRWLDQRQDTSYWHGVGSWGWLCRAKESGPRWKTAQGVQNQPAIMPLLTQFSRTALGACPAGWEGGEPRRPSPSRSHALFLLPKSIPGKGPGKSPHTQIHRNLKRSNDPLSF